jgi:UDP-2-acetamido-3-amino-2,3-dideoxy-glucuronate N-acetyltransferase
MNESEKKYFAHETAVVDEPAFIGAGTKIWHFSHVMSGARIGAGCSIGQNVFVGATATIGDNVKIQNNVSIYEGVELEDDVFCGPSCVFTNVMKPRSAYPRENRSFDRTLVKKGATIGANATIVCGVTIGEHAFIGAGAVVTKDVPAHALCFGNPAGFGGWVCKCGAKLKAVDDGETAICPSCEISYKRQGLSLTPAEE